MIDDFDLIVSSFQSEYGIRLSRELPAGMKWDEFRDMLVGLGPDTALGRIVSIRAEDRKEMLEQFTLEQLRIRSEWRSKWAKQMAKTNSQQMDAALEAIRQGFLQMAGIKE